MLRPVHDVENVLGDAGFWNALIVAAAGAAVVWLRLRQHHGEPGIAAVITVAGLVGLRVNHLLETQLVVTVALLGVAEWMFRGRAVAVRLVVFTLGAAMVAATLPSGWPGWSRVALIVVVVVGAFVGPAHDRLVPRLVPVLLAIGAIGVYACVPDTEAPKALLGAVLGACVISLEPPLRASLGLPAAVGLFAWVATFGGLGRPGAIVGGLACLGVLLLPLPRWRPRTGGVVALLLAQAGLVLYESRVAGLEQSAERAFLLSVPAFLVVWLVLAATARVSRR
jgi:hypothetical protein